MKKTAVVTGASSGIGKSTAQALSKMGYTVYGLNRRGCEPGEITYIRTDVTDDGSVNAAVSQILEKEGKIDLLINNAGFGISGAVEFTDVGDAERLFDVNFFGMVRVCRAVIPSMRKAGGGRIINISSVAAIAPIPFQTFYSASKSAVKTYSLALANEVRDFGITVCAVMPGDISTGFTDAREKSAEGDAVYGERISRSVKKMENDERNGMKSSVAGKKIARIAASKSRKPLRTLGFSYKAIAFLIKLLPTSAVNGLIALLYAK